MYKYIYMLNVYIYVCIYIYIYIYIYMYTSYILHIYYICIYIYIYMYGLYCSIASCPPGDSHNQWFYSNWCTSVQTCMVFSVHLHLNLYSSFS